MATMNASCSCSEVEEVKQKEKEDKLWIGNIDKHLTEYQLIQILKKFGEIKKFEFLFHLNGPMKGEPRGYCFVEYETKEQCKKAIDSLNGKKILSKYLKVDWAKPEEKCEMSKKEIKQERKPKELSRKRKIEMLQAKLASLEKDTSSPVRKKSDLKTEPSSKPNKVKNKHKL